MRFLLVLFGVTALSGCSLLFIAKGKTGMAEVKAQEAPHAKSLKKEMDRNVLKHEVQKGESLEFLGKVYYGAPVKGAARIAKANRLRVTSKLKPGRLLKIVEPLYLPSPREMKSAWEDWQKANAAQQADDNTPMDPQLAATTLVARPKVNLAFAAGEKLIYEVKALNVVAGTASLEVDDPVQVQGRPCYPLVAKAKAAFPISTIYPVHDVQTSYFDAVDFLTWKFENDVSEGNYKAQNDELYDQVKHRVWHQHDREEPETMDVPAYTQDIISCFYYFRLLPMEVGKKYAIPTCSGGKNYNVIIDVVKREKITIPMGTFDCYLVKPYVKHNTVFRNEEDIDLWVTADQRHLPVYVKSGIVIGSIDITLVQASLPQIKGVSDKLAQ